MEEIVSITRWDMIVGEDLHVIIDPTRLPRAAGWSDEGVFLNLGGRVFHLAESQPALHDIATRTTIIVVEADEISDRITRIPCSPIGSAR